MHIKLGSKKIRKIACLHWNSLALLRVVRTRINMYTIYFITNCFYLIDREIALKKVPLTLELEA